MMPASDGVPGLGTRYVKPVEAREKGHISMDSSNRRASGRASGFPSTRGRRRTRPALLVAVIAAALACSAAPAGARVVTDQATHHKFGIVPSIGSRFAGSACVADGTDCTALTYHGGTVMHGETFYQLFWTPSGHAVPAAYQSGLNTFLNTHVAYNYLPYTMFSVDQQFYDTMGAGGAKRFVPQALYNAGQLVDTSPYPANGCTDDSMPVCLTDTQLTTELTKYITAHRLPHGQNVEYFIFTPSGVGSCFDSSSSSCAYTSYCGYHSYLGTPNSSTETLYANMPWAQGVSGCDVNLAFGTGNPNGAASGIDSVVGVWSHEASETMTDPNLNAWYQDGGTDSGYENGDKCAYVYGGGGYGSTTGLPNNGSGFYNYKLLGVHDYLAQIEWDQRLRNCSAKDNDTQPVVSLTPTTAVHGTPVTFTEHVTDAAGINNTRWYFGDGTNTTTTTGTTVTHTYATAGTKHMEIILTDGHGNEKKLIQTVTVS